MSALPELPSEAFKAWWREYEIEQHFGCGEVASGFAFDAWQASRKQAMEEAAKLCDHIGDNHDAPMCDVAWDCEIAIKELLK